jgi:predicted Zn-dependent peptidase
MQFTQHKLKNGTRLIVAPQKETGAFSIIVFFKVGSRYESRDINGISHYIEHFAFKGTKKRPTAEILCKELNSYGAVYNASTDKEYTSYYVKIRAKYAEQAMEIISDIIYNSKFDAQELDRERKVVLEEVHMQHDNPMMYIGDMAEREVYGDVPLGFFVGGDDKSMEKISRKDILGYYKKHYIPTNTVVVMSGNMEGVDTLKLAEKYFGKQKVTGGVAGCEKFAGKFAQKITVEEREGAQFQLAISFPCFDYKNKQTNAVDLLAEILGGFGFGSRLFIQVRERRGLAYAIHAINAPYADTGSFLIRAGINKENLPLAVKTILEELKKIKQKGVTAKELADAKEVLKGHAVLGLEDSSEIAEWLGMQELLKDKVLTLEEIFARLDKVTVAEVNALADKIFDLKKMYVAILGPLKDATKIEKIIKSSNL